MTTCERALFDALCKHTYYVHQNSRGDCRKSPNRICVYHLTVSRFYVPFASHNESERPGVTCFAGYLAWGR